MKRLVLSGLLLALGLAAACGDNGSSDQNGSPTAAPASPTSAISADQVITLTQEYTAQHKVDNPDGTFRLEQSTIRERVDDLCADEAQWSARQSSESTWRVVAECKKKETETPVAYGYELLHFEWLCYSDIRQVMPVSGAAHDAQYPFRQPSTPGPTGTP